MKTLILMRHAQAAELQSGKDIERPLTQAGRGMAVWVAGELSKKGLWPDFIVCSSAQRTKQTCQLMQDTWAPDAYPQVIFDPAIYRADAHECAAMFNDQDEDHQTVLMIGHNPSIHQAVLLLSAAGEVQKMPQLAGNFPPASCVILNFEVDDWALVRKGTGVLVDFFHPIS